jgi:hypothetical protein
MHNETAILLSDIQEVIMNRKKVYKRLDRDGILDMNGCKLLNCQSSRGSYFFWFRDRQQDQSYFLIRIRGNYIKAFCIRYENAQGHGINTYLGLTVPAIISGEMPEELPVRKKNLILKMKIKDYKNFVSEFRKITPSLQWWDEDEFLSPEEG